MDCMIDLIKFSTVNNCMIKLIGTENLPQGIKIISLLENFY